MPGFPVPFIKFREVDANGDPLAGGWLYSYAAGTSTPLATYAEQSLDPGTENENPTELDASGRANIWVEDGVAYKFVLKDHLFNTIWTQDNVQLPAIEAPAVAAEVPTGGIIMFGGTVAPAGWLMCDGASVSQATYQALYNVIGEAYGSGGGTFNVPNLQQRFPMGKALAGTGATLGATGGTIDHTHTGPSHTHPIPSHTHTMAHTHSVPHDGWTTTVNSPPTAGILQAGGTGTGGESTVSQASVANTSGGSSTADTGGPSVPLVAGSGGTEATGTANPPFVTLNFVIKT